MKTFSRSHIISTTLIACFSAVLAVQANAGVPVTTIPHCLSKGVELPQNDDQVATWKKSTANQFLARAHVTGTIHQIFPDHSGHNHFEIQMDTPAGDTLEIIYNQSFGALPTLHSGMKVEACGDYITSDAATSQYPASPDGAILHWIHNNTGGGRGGASHALNAESFTVFKKHNGGGQSGGGNTGGGSTSGGKHDAGYLAIDGQVYGGY